jgi:hypothetical protein
MAYMKYATTDLSENFYTREILFNSLLFKSEERINKFVVILARTYFCFNQTFI